MLSMISNLVKRYNKWGWRWFFVDFYEYIIKFQYNKYIRGELAMKKLVSDYQFETVLDIGCGNGSASRFFTENGKVVTACDYGRSVSFKDTMAKDVIIGDFNTLDFGDKKYDCIWCSHVLEHQLNVQSFLEKINSLLAEGGVLCVTVPPYKNQTLGGHVSWWSRGMLLYRLVLAGFDCTDAEICRYGYNISAIVKKKSISILNLLSYDGGDMMIIKNYLPRSIKYRDTGRDVLIYGDRINIWH